MKSELANLLNKKLGDLTLGELSEALTLVKNLSSSLSEFEKQPEQNIGGFIDTPRRVVRIVEFVDTYSTADAIMRGRIKHALARYACFEQKGLNKPNCPYKLGNGKVNPSYVIDLTRISEEDIYSMTQGMCGQNNTKQAQEIKKIFDSAGIKTL